MTEQTKLYLDDLWQLFARGGLADLFAIVDHLSLLLLLKSEQLQLDKQRGSLSTGRATGGWFILVPSELDWQNLKSQSEKRQLELLGLASTTGITFSTEIGEPQHDPPRFTFNYYLLTPGIIGQAIHLIDNVAALGSNVLDGEVYEYLISKIYMAHTKQRFPSPPFILGAPVELARPQLQDRILDPVAGTGAFLLATFRFLKAHRPDVSDSRFPFDSAVALESDHIVAKIASFNLLLNEFNHETVQNRNLLTSPSNQLASYDLIVANPPFGKVSGKDLVPELRYLNTTNGAVLFVERCIQLLRPGGRAIVIVPQGLLYNSSVAHRQFRQGLIENSRLLAITYLPGGTWKPLTAVKTAILFIEKSAVTKGVFFCRIEKPQLASDSATLRDTLCGVTQAIREQITSSQISKERRTEWPIAQHAWGLISGIPRGGILSYPGCSEEELHKPDDAHDIRIRIVEQERKFNDHLLSIEKLVRDLKLLDGQHSENLTISNVTSGKHAISQKRIPQEGLMLLRSEIDAAKRIAIRSKESTDRLKECLFEDLFGDPLSNEFGWESVSLGDIVEKPQMGSWQLKCEKRAASLGEFAVLKTSAVTSGTFVIEENKALRNPSTFPSELRLSNGDVLFTRANSLKLIGATVIVDSDYPEMTFPDKVWRLRPRSGNTGEFVAGLLSTSSVKQRIRSVALGTLPSMVNITQERFLKILAFRPSLEMQEKFSGIYWDCVSQNRWWRTQISRILTLSSFLSDKVIRDTRSSHKISSPRQA